MNKQDKRYEQTHQKIREHFIRLWEKKTVAEITVTELTRAADINRSSFYMHYNKIIDVKKDLEEEFLEELDRICGQYPKAEEGIDSEIVYSFYIDVNQMLLDNIHFLLAAFGDYGDIRFYLDFLHMMRKKTFQLMIRILGANCNPDAAENCRCLSWSFVAGWQAAMTYCYENNNSGKFIPMVKAIDGDVKNNMKRILKGEFLTNQ